MKEKYNLDKLIKVKKYDLLEEKRLVYLEPKEEKKWLWFTTEYARKGGYYRCLSDGYPTDCYHGETLPKENILLDGKIYKKPIVKLIYEGDISKDYYFETEKEADDFYNKLTSTNNWIE